MWETWVPSLNWEDPLEEGVATHSSILVWSILMDRGAWPAKENGVLKSDKEIQPVHPKGDQSWVFIGWIDVETEIPPDAKS